MKRFTAPFAIAIAVIATIVALPAGAQYPEGAIYAGSALVNPAANAVMIDTGALDDQSSTNAGQAVAVKVFCSQTVAARYYIQVRDATNTVTRFEAFLMGGVNLTSPWDPSPIAFKLNDNERVRVLMQAAITGTAKCEIALGTYQVY